VGLLEVVGLALEVAEESRTPTCRAVLDVLVRVQQLEADRAGCPWRGWRHRCQAASTPRKVLSMTDTPSGRARMAVALVGQQLDDAIEFDAGMQVGATLDRTHTGLIAANRQIVLPIAHVMHPYTARPTMDFAAKHVKPAGWRSSQ